jgi:GTP cyclohydrolase I
MNIDYEKLRSDSLVLATKIGKGNFEAVYGIPNGGLIPAYIIAQALKIPLISYEQFKKDPFHKQILIVDDLIDTGKTLEQFKECSTAVVYKKKSAPEPTYFQEEISDDWIGLPHEAENPIAGNITRVLEFIGEDPRREGLLETPNRVVKSYGALFGGYKQNVKDILTTFSSENYDQIILLKDIEFYSTCEHHMLPFFGKAHVAYIPNDKIVGISKLARIVEIFSRRLQNQERLTDQIAQALQDELNPKAVGVVMEAKHFCMIARGVQKQNSVMKTSSLKGSFLEKGDAREEFFNLIK